MQTDCRIEKTERCTRQSVLTADRNVKSHSSLIPVGQSTVENVGEREGHQEDEADISLGAGVRCRTCIRSDLRYANHRFFLIFLICVEISQICINIVSRIVAALSFRLRRMATVLGDSMILSSEDDGSVTMLDR